MTRSGSVAQWTSSPNVINRKPVGRKPKKVYELTEEGRQLATILFKRLASLVSIAIEPSLNVCAHCGAKIF